MEVTCRVVLKRGREKAALNRHPWVFSGAVARIEGEAAPGLVADLVLASGEFVARGFVNPDSQIVFRALSYRREVVGRELLEARLREALALREGLLGGDTDAYRLVNAEGDRLPGLAVDRYGEWLVVQIGSAGMERVKQVVVELLAELVRPRGIYERSGTPARAEEGLEPSEGVLFGEAPPEHVTVREGGVSLVADLARGLKTGLYLDQRTARGRLRGLAKGRDVLDCFAYSGGFSLNALAGGAASVTVVERQKAALALFEAGLEANGLGSERAGIEVCDVFRFLRATERDWDIIVLDPPPFAKRKGEVQGACRGYKELHREALRRLRPGGLLLTSSCSHHVDPWLFQQLLFQASREIGRQARLLGRWGHAPDHPVLLDHPQGEYLKVFLIGLI